MADLGPSSEISFFQIFLCSAFAACFAELNIPIWAMSYIYLRLCTQLVAICIFFFPQRRVSRFDAFGNWVGLEFRTEKNYEPFSLEDGWTAPYLSTIIYSAYQFCTIPLDTAKVRLQLQRRSSVGDGMGSPKYRGLLGTVATIAEEEGLSALWRGIIPGLQRQCIYGGLRIGLYEPVKTFLVGDAFVGDIPLYHKILAALVTGALAIAIANPTDLVKVRLQAEGKLPSGVPRRYSGALDAYTTIVKQEGIGALWTGIGPNITRNAIINAAELASYDQVKQTILKIPGFMDNIFTQLLAGLGAGFFAVCIGSPVDVMKSRMMGDSAYKNTIECFIKTLKTEGFFAFYKGFFPNFGRLGSWNVIMFLTFEQAKKLLRGP